MSCSLFSRFREPIETAITESLSTFGSKSGLRDAIVYALKNGGKRFRPAIVYMVAEAIGKSRDVTDAALAIEFFHTASLIADDLPCMDDDEQRRGHSSLHRAFDEATAILATYALIAAGYDKIRLAAQKFGSEKVGLLAIENASHNTGIFGATGGQYDDLYPPTLSEETVLDVIDKKTGTLFEISFVFGWLFGGGDLSLIEEVKEMARSFGRAFQISDDLLDLEQDGEGINYPAIVGIEKGRAVLLNELEKFKEGLKKLQLETPELTTLSHLIEERVKKTTQVLSQ